MKCENPEYLFAKQIYAMAKKSYDEITDLQFRINLIAMNAKKTLKEARVRLDLLEFDLDLEEDENDSE